MLLDKIRLKDILRQDEVTRLTKAIKSQKGEWVHANPSELMAFFAKKMDYGVFERMKELSEQCKSADDIVDFWLTCDKDKEDFPGSLIDARVDKARLQTLLFLVFNHQEITRQIWDMSAQLQVALLKKHPETIRSVNHGLWEGVSGLRGKGEDDYYDKFYAAIHSDVRDSRDKRGVLIRGFSCLENPFGPLLASGFFDHRSFPTTGEVISHALQRTNYGVLFFRPHLDAYAAVAEHKFKEKPLSPISWGSLWESAMVALHEGKPFEDVERKFQTGVRFLADRGELRFRDVVNVGSLKTSETSRLWAAGLLAADTPDTPSDKVESFCLGMKMLVGALVDRFSWNCKNLTKMPKSARTEAVGQIMENALDVLGDYVQKYRLAFGDEFLKHEFNIAVKHYFNIHRQAWLHTDRALSRLDDFFADPNIKLSDKQQKQAQFERDLLSVLHGWLNERPTVLESVVDVSVFIKNGLLSRAQDSEALSSLYQQGGRAACEPVLRAYLDGLIREDNGVLKLDLTKTHNGFLKRNFDALLTQIIQQPDLDMTEVDYAP